jgi:serine/threonine protein kinase
MRLARGGMGEVWQAYDAELGRAVALKMLHRFDASDEPLQRFRREASIGAQLAHPGITVVYDVGHHDDQMFMVMELLEGEDLAQLLKRSPKGLPMSEAIDLGVQAAQALAAAHAQKIVHRDLKPANLFLLANGRLKICDFGIARTAESTEGLTVTGSPLGSPPYMAPEQWRGEHVDAQCDLYALGCVLYALLTGEPPFSVQGQPWVLMHQHLDETPPDLQAVKPDVPAGVAELMVELLAKDPAARPDATATAQRLRHLNDVRANAPVPLVPAASRHTSPPMRTPYADAPRLIESPRGPLRRGILLRGLATLAGVSGGTLLTVKLTADADGSESTERRLPPSFTLRGFGGAAYSVAFNTDGRMLATGGADNKIRLWDVRTGTRLTVRNSRSQELKSVAFRPFNKALACGGPGSSVELWGFDTVAKGGQLASEEPWAIDTRGRPLTPLRSVSGPYAMAFSPNGTVLATGTEHNSVVLLRDVGVRERAITLTGHAGPVLSVAFTSDGAMLASGSADGTVLLWNVELATTTGPTTGLQSDSFSDAPGVRAMAFSPDGRTLAVADGTIRLWNVAAEADTAILTTPSRPMYALAFSPDGKTLATGDLYGAVRLWNVATRKSFAVLTGHKGNVESVVFSHDGKSLASASADMTVQLWELS